VFPQLPSVLSLNPNDILSSKSHPDLSSSFDWDQKAEQLPLLVSSRFDRVSFGI
jgi:hypothetical protein